MSPKRRRVRRSPGVMGKGPRKWMRAQGKKHERIIEVGSLVGEGTVLLAENGATVWAVDNWPDTRILNEFNERTREYQAEGKIISLHMRSVEAAKIIQANWGPIFDFIFIDADHSYEGCKDDIISYLPLLDKGGVISGHDYVDHWPGVMEAVDEIFGGRVKLGPGSIWQAE